MKISRLLFSVVLLLSVARLHAQEKWDAIWLLGYDALGRLVLSEPLFNGVTEINTAHLSAGFYYWSIQTGGVILKTGKGWKV